MDIRQKNNFKALALAVVIAIGTGLVRVIDAPRRWLQKISTTISVNVAGLKATANAPHEDSLDAESTIAGVKR